MNQACRFSLFQLPTVSEAQPEDQLYECSCHPGRQNSKSNLKYPKVTEVITQYPFVSGNSLVSGGSLLPGGQLISSSQLATAGASFEPVSASTSIGSVSGSSSLGPITGSTSLDFLSSNAAIKSPFLNFNARAALPSANFVVSTKPTVSDQWYITPY